ncbi:MAG: diguanylate cyclase [Chromatocurvus sp.]
MSFYPAVSIVAATPALYWCVHDRLASLTNARTTLQCLAALIIGCLTATANGAMAPPLDLSRVDASISLTAHIDSWREDAAAESAGDEVPPVEVEWQRGMHPLEAGSGGALWLRFRLRFEGGGHGDWLLTLPTTAVEDALFLGPFDAAGHPLATSIRSGLNHPFATRPLGNERLVFPLQMTQPGVYTVFLRLDSSIRLTVDPELWRPGEYLAGRKHKTLFDGICYGILVTLLVYNLVLTVAFRSRAYLFYVLTCASALLTLSTYNGHAAHYVWPATPWLIRETYTLAPALWLFFSALFARDFLSLRATMPWADRGVLGLAGVMIATLAIGLAGFREQAQTLTEIVAVSGVLFISAMAFLLWRRGSERAPWYLGAQAVLFLSAVLVVLVNWGLVESPFLLANALQIGVSAEMILFAVALSARINRVQTEKAELDLRATHLALAASTDPLTGVANRTGLAHAAERLLQSPGDHALLLIDLNNFKAINDQNGHEAGDLTLVETARRLEKHLRSSDFIARTGGDEFVILLAGRPEQAQLDTTLARLHEALAEPIVYNDSILSITASIGVAHYPGNGDNLQALQRAADHAMYRAKKAGVPFSYSSAETDGPSA